MCLYSGVSREGGAAVESIEMRKNSVLWSLNSLHHQKHSEFEIFVVLSFSVKSFATNANEDISQLRNRPFIFLL